MQIGPIDLEFHLQILPLLLHATLTTIWLTLAAIFFGTIIGLIIALAKISRVRILSAIGGIYTWVLRGIPLLVQLYILYYGLPQLGIKLSAPVAAVTGLSICGGAYIAEIIRAGIQSIDRGQLEAAFSLGMSYGQAFRRVILPQAYRRLLPPMGNEFILLMKDSCLVSVISMTELLRQGKLLANSTFRPMEIFIDVAIIYLILTTVLVHLVEKLEKRLAVSEGE